MFPAHKIKWKKNHNAYRLPNQIRNHPNTIQNYITNAGLTFDIHMSVHRKNNSKLQPKVAAFLDLFISTDALRISGGFLRPSSGAHNCIYSFRYCQPILLLAAIVNLMELSSTIAASSSTGWQYLKLYVQLCAPDDGRRNPPEIRRASVEINKSKNAATFGCNLELYLHRQCIYVSYHSHKKQLLFSYTKLIILFL